MSLYPISSLILSFELPSLCNQFWSSGMLKYLVSAVTFVTLQKKLPLVKRSAGQDLWKLRWWYITFMYIHVRHQNRNYLHVLSMIFREHFLLNCLLCVGYDKNKCSDVGAWKCNFKKIMKDRQTNRPTDRIIERLHFPWKERKVCIWNFPSYWCFS